VGPHIGPCCFEVGPEVARRFEDDPGAVVSAAELRVKRSRRDSQALDLNAVIYRRLAASGVPPEAITAATACTRCETSILHSYRRNGKGGPLMAAVAAVLP
jgi:copper oxidase (laccase) domain-containing protein